jgi:hypothetical protein
MSKPQFPPTETAEQRRELWKVVQEVGGISSYLRKEIEGLEFSTIGRDPTQMNAKQKAQYKEDKRKESEFRRALKKQIWQAYREVHLVHLGEGIFYNDLVDADRFDIEKREQRLADNDLPKLETIEQLAAFFDLSIPQLRWLSYHKNADTGSHYTQFTIPKADGSERTISAPKPKLKACQRKILRDILSPLPIHGAAHGFVPGRSIATHAAVHAGAKVIIKIDLQQFFPTVVFPRVKGLFRKIGYPEQVATVLALLATDAPRAQVELNGKTYHVALQDRCLPQGAPTSPTITNLLCVRMDRRLSGIAQKYNWQYSRYADDMAFSWHCDEPAPISAILAACETIANAEGFRINPKKTRVMRQSSRQSITGLVVNQMPSTQTDHPRPPRQLLRQIRAAIHNHTHNRPTKAGESLAQLLGLAAFVNQSDPQRGLPLLQQIRTLIAKEEAETP